MHHKDGRSSFRTLQKFSPDYAPCTITKYESERTGMSVVVVDREGPKVNGFFTLATEIHDDSGARKPPYSPCLDLGNSIVQSTGTQ